MAAVGVTPAAAVESHGYIEICKVSAPAPLNVSGKWTFTVSQSGSSPVTISVPVGACSPDTLVPSGVNTVTEQSNTWSQVTAITQPANENYIVAGSINLGARSVQVNVAPAPSAGDISLAATVTYTNQLVQGTLEICKAAPAGSTLTGNYTFAVTAPNDTTDGTTATTSQVNSFSTSVTVPVGACSAPFLVPAGNVTTVDTNGPGAASGANGTTNVTAITATANSANRLVSTNLGTSAAVQAATAVVTVNAGDVSKETVETYTNEVVQLKVCKVWDTQTGGTAPTTAFPFSFTASGPLGPNAAPSAITLVAGTCQILNPTTGFRAGTTVTVTEGIVPGTKVESIIPTQAAGTPSSTSSLIDRTISVILGPGQSLVTFTDTSAHPGQLKICATQAVGLSVPTVSSFSYTVADASANPASQTVVVPVGSCVFAGGDTTPTQFPFNSTATITQTASTGNAVSDILVTPPFVVETINGTPTSLTDQPSSNSKSIGGTSAASSINVVIGENDNTVANFLVFDPPVAGTGTSAGTSGTGVINAGGVTVFVPTVSSGSTSASVATTSVTPGVTSSAGTGLSVLNLEKTQLVQYSHKLTTVKAQEQGLIKKLASKHGFHTHAGRVAAEKQLKALNTQVKTLTTQVALLKKLTA
jgi:hypothetical protein